MCVVLGLCVVVMYVFVCSRMVVIHGIMYCTVLRDWLMFATCYRYAMSVAHVFNILRSMLQTEYVADTIYPWKTSATYGADTTCPYLTCPTHVAWYNTIHNAIQKIVKYNILSHHTRCEPVRTVEYFPNSQTQRCALRQQGMLCCTPCTSRAVFSCF